MRRITVAVALILMVGLVAGPAAWAQPPAREGGQTQVVRGAFAHRSELLADGSTRIVPQIRTERATYDLNFREAPDELGCLKAAREGETFIVAGRLLGAPSVATAPPSAPGPRVLMVQKFCTAAAFEAKAKEIQDSKSVMVGFMDGSFDEASEAVRRAGFRVLNRKEDADPRQSQFFTARLNVTNLGPEQLAKLEGASAIDYIAPMGGAVATIPPGEAAGGRFETSPTPPPTAPH